MPTGAGLADADHDGEQRYGGDDQAGINHAGVNLLVGAQLSF